MLLSRVFPRGVRHHRYDLTQHNHIRHTDLVILGINPVYGIGIGWYNNILCIILNYIRDIFNVFRDLFTYASDANNNNIIIRTTETQK